MAYQCVYCENEAEFDSNVCSDCLGNEQMAGAAALSLVNMAVPPYYFCGHCGDIFEPEELAGHVYKLLLAE